MIRIELRTDAFESDAAEACGDAETESAAKKTCRKHAILWRVKISRQEEIKKGFSFESVT